MITERTVIVTGAGASFPFGFPTGMGLSKLVVEGLNSDQPHHRVLQEAGFTQNDILTFRDEFCFSGRNSVDAFLEFRTEFMNIGKAVIACFLITSEIRSTLFTYSDTNWLRYLFQKLHSPSLSDFGNNAVSFVTFNYDRSIEEFLFTSLRNSFGAVPDECAAQVNSIPIIHLHGRLGSLPWQDTDSPAYDPSTSRAYEPNTSPMNIMKSAQGIKIIHEDLSSGRDNDFSDAKTLLLSAERVIFLGFGFAPVNVGRLGLRDMKVVGESTAVGYTASEAAEARLLCEGKVLFPSLDMDCIGLLRNIVWHTRTA